MSTTAGQAVPLALRGQHQHARIAMQIHLPELQKNEKYAGITLMDGHPHENIILLPGKFFGTWKQCSKWAEAQGGELPDQQAGALLYANLKDEFEGHWYWLSQQVLSDRACIQHFHDGFQNGYPIDMSLRARAIRRLSI